MLWDKAGMNDLFRVKVSSILGWTESGKMLGLKGNTREINM